MPLTSRASAGDDLSVIDEAADSLAVEPALAPAPRKPSTIGLWPEAARNIAVHGFDPVFAWFRRGLVYRSTLRGPVPDRVIYHPQDPRTRRLDDADQMFRGRFHLAGSTLDVKEGSVFDQKLPDANFAAALHSFEWLKHLEAAGSESARDLAQKLTADWLVRYARYSEPAWSPEIISARFYNLFSHGRFFLHGSDVMWRSKLFVSLRNQARVLARRMRQAPDGIVRFESAAGLVLAGLCLSDARNTDQGIGQLDIEIARQILPDGGHIDRSPESLLRAFFALTMVQQAMEATHRQVPDSFRAARDRMAPMIRFFRLGDGGLACFNGGNQCDPRVVSALLAADDAKGMPFGHARYSAYQRLAAGRSFVLMDTGIAPPGAFASHAHAGCLSFEMSSGPHRVIVNCGASHDEQWEAALRATAAHSTLTLADTSSGMVLPEGLVRDLLGPRLYAGPNNVETQRDETPHGVMVEAWHDGYAGRFGMAHERRIALSPKGIVMTGSDRLVPVERKHRKAARETARFAIRFHIHPDVKLSLAQGVGTVLLKLPNGEGWRFRASGDLVIEESIYCGGGAPRRAEQIVIYGSVGQETVECDWALELAGSS